MRRTRVSAFFLSAGEWGMSATHLDSGGEYNSLTPAHEAPPVRLSLRGGAAGGTAAGTGRYGGDLSLARFRKTLATMA